MQSVLSGVRVLDVTTALSGPVATSILGDLGADVIKIEPPQGDSIRNLGPARNPGMGAMFMHANRSKRSVVLDLRKESAREAFLLLVQKVDVLVCNLRPSYMLKMGLSKEQLLERNERLIYLNIVGYGGDSDYANDPAYDDLIQAAAGLTSLHAPGQEARYAPIALADRTAGLYAAKAVLAALYHQAKTGQGQHIEVSMFEVIASLVLGDHMGGLTFEPSVGAPIFKRYSEIRRPFQTKDSVICVMMLTDKQWETFFEAIKKPEIIQEHRFRHMRERSNHLEELYEIVADILLTRTTEQWLALFRKIDIPAVKAETIESLLEHPHLQQTGFFQIQEHPSEGSIRSMVGGSQWSRTQPGPTRPTPRLGEHTEEVLTEIGLTAKQISEL